MYEARWSRPKLVLTGYAEERYPEVDITSDKPGVYKLSMGSMRNILWRIWELKSLDDDYIEMYKPYSGVNVEK